MSDILILAFVISILSHGYYVGASVRSARDEVNLESVNLNVDLSRVLKRVNERFLSVAIDASLVAEEKFMYLLTFGGTRQDFMTFNPAFLHSNEYHKNSVFDADDLCERLELPPLLEERLKQEWALQEVLLQKEDLQRKYRSVKFTEYAVDLLYSFTNCSGLDLIFGLNELLRTTVNSWDSSNARTLIQYCESKQYSMSWELGNEPNSYEKKAGIRVDGYQLGQDFVQLRKILRESKLYHDTGVYGPDITQPRDHSRDLLEGYYVNGRQTSLEDFLDPEVLNTLALKTRETVDLASPGKKVWLGETSSAYGGGAKGLSDTFVAGFITSYKSGAVTLFALNLSKSPVKIAVPAMVSNSTVEAFVLQSEQPGKEGLYSKSVKLNGEVLKMVDDRTLPSLQGTPLAAGEHLRLPGYSFAFYVLSKAQALACR
ncbi:unnamed protein product [Coregonus sp. 'balchen']|nr:unnamed protein product [Coregonus sp. 'balchen']